MRITKAADIANKLLLKWFKVRFKKSPLTCAVLCLNCSGIMVPVVRPTPVRAAL